MIKIDPVIAVKDMVASTRWYEQVFGFKKAHGTGEIAVLVSEQDGIVLCLHQWGVPDHPSMKDPGIPSGNGLLFYIRTENMMAIRQNMERLGWKPAQDIHRNPNSLKKEFSVRDPDGYYLTITEYHEYEG